MTKDTENLYFYVSTAENFISPGEEETLWMTLLLNTDCNYKTGWGGYDFIVTGKPSGMELRKNSGDGYAWEKVADVVFRIEGNKMMLAVPRVDLCLESTDVDVDFKWADNTSIKTPDIMRFISDGDAAPNGRFNYRYKGASLPNAGMETVKIDEAPQLNWSTENGTVFFSTEGNQVLDIEIVNPAGMKVASLTAKHGEEVSANLSHGIYFVSYRINNSASRSVVKIVI